MDTNAETLIRIAKVLGRISDDTGRLIGDPNLDGPDVLPGEFERVFLAAVTGMSGSNLSPKAIVKRAREIAGLATDPA